jgi:hypothetical protein
MLLLLDNGIVAALGMCNLTLDEYLYMHCEFTTVVVVASP